MNVLVKTQKIQVLLRGALGRGKVHQALVMGHNVCFGVGGAFDSRLAFNLLWCIHEIGVVKECLPQNIKGNRKKFR